MHTVNNVRKLAQLLLKEGKIDRTGFDHIVVKLSESEKSEAKTGRNGSRRKNAHKSGGEAIRFISGLDVKLADDPSKTVTDEEIVKSVAAKFKARFKKLDPLDLDIDIVTRTIPKPYALKHLVLPLYERDGTLFVALVDPENMEPIDGISRVTGKDIEQVLATPDDIVKIIHEFFGFKSSVVKAEEEMSAPRIDIGNLEQLSKIKKPEQIQSNDEHIKNAVEYLFNYALELRASDIHVEPKREKTLVRFRIDGVLHDVYKIPKGIHPAIASRIKMLARLNIAEKRRPQDGRIRIEIEGNTSEIRVSTMPTAFGEKLVLRVLQPELLMRDMEDIGFSPEDYIKMEKFLTRPYGLVLVTGPTGSGKTTTLYSAMGNLVSPEKNIITIEDPIETISEQFNQVAVQPSVGITFASSLRTILRQDPDIIMIGEIRDHETAENAIQAALTGHLVLSTLHTNDTTSSITRLEDLGVKPFLINSAVIGIVAQRLTRVICPHCAESKQVSKEKLAIFGVSSNKKTVTLREGKGCEECRFTGFLGRTGVYEVLELSSDIKKMIQKGESTISIRKYALEHGMTSLKENAVRKMLNGQTTISEVLRLGFEIY